METFNGGQAKTPTKNIMISTAIKLGANDNPMIINVPIAQVNIIVFLLPKISPINPMAILPNTTPLYIIEIVVSLRGPR